MAQKGLVLINLGSPEQPQVPQIRRFLKRFLADPRVIHFPRLLWKPILHGIIAPMRPAKIKPIYEQIWMAQGSPLAVYSRRQEQAVQSLLGPEVIVRAAMTYSQPLVADVLREFGELEVEEVCIIALYPQYAASSVGACFDAVARFYQGQAVVPHLRFVRSWHLQPQMIDYYARSLTRQLSQSEYDAVVLSYHGVPNVPVHSPQLYHRHCRETTAAIIARMRQLIGPELPRVVHTYQSKFGPGEWIGPATIETVQALPAEGAKRIVVATPGFVSDCIETLDEIAVLNRDAFLAGGGHSFSVIPPLNDDPAFAEAIADIYQSG